MKLNNYILTDETKDSDQSLQAKSIILSTLSEGIIGSVLSCKTAREIWVHLRISLGTKSSNEKRELWAEISSLKATSAKEVPDVKNKLLTCKGRLKTLNIDIDEQHAISALIRSLPSEFKPFTDTWEMFDTDQQTLTRFIEKLRERAKTLVEMEPTTVMMANMTQEKKLDVICNYCGNIGHFESDCRKLAYNMAMRQRARPPLRGNNFRGNMPRGGPMLRFAMMHLQPLHQQQLRPPQQLHQQFRLPGPRHTLQNGTKHYMQNVAQNVMEPDAYYQAPVEYNYYDPYYYSQYEPNLYVPKSSRVWRINSKRN